MFKKGVSVFFAVRSLWTVLGFVFFPVRCQNCSVENFAWEVPSTAVWPAHYESQGEARAGDGGWGWKPQLKCSEVPWIPICLRPLQSSAQLPFTRRCNLSSLQKQTGSHKTAVVLWYQRRNVQPASCCSSEKQQPPFVQLLGFFTFFAFKIKNLPKKAYKVYGRSIQEAN